MNRSNRERKPLLVRVLVGSRPKLTMVRVVVLALASFLVFRYAFRPMIVDGISMEPTIRDNSFMFANLLAYRSRAPQRGDIVLVDKDTFNTMYMKRVIGLPGESVAFRNGDLYVDGELAPENYLDHKGDWNMKTVRLGPNEFLVAGDNRTVPRRAHLMGVVRREVILGELIGKGISADED